MRLPWLREGDADSQLRRNHKEKLVLDRRTETWYREIYERWLEERGARSSASRSTTATRPQRPGMGPRPGTSSRPLEGERRESIRARGVGRRPDRSADSGPRHRLDATTAAYPPGRETLVRPARPAAGLRSVDGDEPAALLARASDGHEVARWRRAGHFQEETVAALADLMFGERRLDRSSLCSHA